MKHFVKISNKQNRITRNIRCKSNSGIFIPHCEYGPAVENVYKGTYKFILNEAYFLRNRKMNKEVWERSLRKLKY